MTEPLTHRLMAILAADAVGYSRHMAEDDFATVEALDDARAVFRARTEANGGRLVDTAGDSVLAVFVSAHGAIAAALAAQDELATVSAASGKGRALTFRVGVHLGDVIEKSDGTVYGDGVNVAARLQAAAAAGGVVVSKPVLDVVRLRLNVPPADLGELSVKNIDRPVHAFAIEVTGAAPVAAPRLSAPRSRTSPVASKPPGPPGVTLLPPAPPSLIGRDEDLRELLQTLGESRVVTLLGTGGIGKTALALAAAHQVRGEQPVAWIDLASISGQALLCGAIGKALGVAVAGRDPLAALVRGLASRRMLLVMDNAEHLVDAIANLVSALAAGAPGLRILVTSQVALHIEGEWLFRLRALAVPAASTRPDEALLHGAVALFAAQARAADQRFALTEANVDAVVDLCRRLDGVALAIKLAAARLPLLGLPGLIARLDERFRLLAGGTRDAPSRQQTMRAALDWSYELLSQAEQSVFRRLGVFLGSFDLDLAGRAAADEQNDPWAAIEMIGSLVDRSLIVVETGEDTRYRLLESAREYALLQLDSAGERASAHSRLADAILQHAPDLARQQPQTLAWHLTESGRRVEAVPYWAQAAAAAGARSEYVEAAHHLEHAIGLLRESASRDASQHSVMRRTELPLVVKLGALHMLTRGVGSREAEADFERARMLAAEVGTLADRFIATFNLWFVSEAQLKFERAGLYIEDTQRLALESGDTRFVLQAHHAGWTTSVLLGHFGKALEHADAGYRLYRPVDAAYHRENFVGHDPGICAFGVRACASFSLGDVDGAYGSAESALQAIRGTDHEASRVVGLYGVCGMFVLARDPESLRAPAAEALATCRKLSLTQYEGLFLAFSSWVMAVADRDPDAADHSLEGVRLFGSTGSRLRLPLMRTIAAESCLAVGRLDEAETSIELALREIDTHGEVGWQAMALGVHAAVSHERGRDAEAERHYLDAVGVALKQQAPGLALRAANGLARIWWARGDRDRVRTLLVPLLDSFKPGHRGTRDLAEARAMVGT